ncbi:MULTISPECIES: hypothetical protein [unclassified Rhizobium]|uniref:hypothetical protein n=1 Tax=unclassified Rhizobium TaxID=2613769 RepID=UPI0014854281|nr:MULTISPECIES: hypothetical protein [unclassified Rhizobium]
MNYLGNIRARFARASAYDSSSSPHNHQARGKIPIVDRAGFPCSHSCETLLRPDIGN